MPFGAFRAESVLKATGKALPQQAISLKAIFGLFLINYWHWRLPYTPKEVKIHIGISVAIIYDLCKSYIHHLSKETYNTCCIITFFMKRDDFYKKNLGPIKLFTFNLNKNHCFVVPSTGRE